MKKNILLVFVLGAIAWAGTLTFTSDEMDTLLGHVNSGLTTNIAVYGQAAGGGGIVTNNFTYTNGILYAFP